MSNSEAEINAARWTRHNPYPATFSSQKRLTGENSAKDVRHIEVDLGDSGITYTPGDTLAIWIRNDPALVAEILGLAALSGQELVELDGGNGTSKQRSLTTALTDCLEITQAYPGFIKNYAACTTLPALQAISADAKALRAFIENRQIVDVLKQFPATLSAQQLVDTLRPLTPRQYSIASSQKLSPHSVQLTVSQVQYQQEEALRNGAGSGFLGWRVQPGQSIDAFVIDNPNFRLPQNDLAPVIMIGPGTGIAPFRAFLQEREARSAQGKNWLFFGNPYSATDYLYQQELEHWLDNGVLTHLDLAFSRDQQGKLYVQHCLQQHAAEVFSWLEQGAYVYVCGDARHMAEDVQKALIAIIAEQAQLDEASARKYLVNMRQQKRYQRDVY